MFNVPGIGTKGKLTTAPVFVFFTDRICLAIFAEGHLVITSTKLFFNSDQRFLRRNYF